ncbi:cytochrome C biogenesis protein [Rhodovarius crocodyli]|uniref:Cytochrome C biogenesis protein n=1 Tax=Rhodovarius crocodyli TaxID=1979269 RepID=A0A437MIU0_9PROT|nr:protein-disulfide reductase DsbD domain-containing protein [Rhodovarius crocodyli]RVT97559.1 cytochrome C biogenesis protein [Rhodovarius crocodyli]
MLRALPLLALALTAALPARAAEAPRVSSPRASVTIISEDAAVAPGRPFRLALQQDLTAGWHTYWTNPGDAGSPPEVTFTLPEGASAGPLQFPAPHRIPYGPLMNFGYEGQALFPVTLTVPPDARPGETITISAEATWLVCERVCIPEEGSFTLTLPVEAAPRPEPETASRFAAADAALPREAPFQVRLGFEGRGGAIEIAGPGIAPGAVREAAFFPTTEQLIDNPAPQEMSLRDGALRLSLTRGLGDVPARVDGIVTITDAQGVRGAYLVSATPGPVPSAAAGLPLWQAVLFAALGGLILNLMPCVFPILAMKALGLARMSGAARGEIRAHAASYTAGVVLSFVAVGGALLGLRLAGGVAGWGFQFTSPVFVACMAWLMLAVGLNLSGVFHVGGPVSAGQGLAGKGGHAGSFFTGALAVLVATPCTAPFMAAALGAAMAMPPVAMLSVFAAMGLGMALPYALIGLLPGIAQHFPRPGMWMEYLKQGLAFPMYGAAAWLAWVLAEQSGATGVLAVLVGGVLVGFAAWALGIAQRAGGSWVGRGLALLALAGAAALLPRLADAPSPTATAAAHGEPWSADRVAALRAEGKPVFVNLTAAWCISCKVNERVALDTTATLAAFEARGVTRLTGDWTRGDPAITSVLREHGREGVPLYIFYPAGGGAPVVLPQILTEGMLLRLVGAQT